MKRVSAVFVFVMMAGAATFAQGDAKKGEAAFTSLKCTTCHAVKGAGGKLAGALDGVATKTSAADLKMWLTDPAKMEAKLEKKPKMAMSASAAFKNKTVTPEQLNDLLAYMATLK